jgi:S-adenosylmethionine:tRNA ribosyltransferase-isomerase
MSALAFELPARLEATEPPAERGRVKLMVATRSTGAIEHHRFDELPRLLGPGDLVVVNVSATLPGAVAGRRERDGSAVRVHFSTPAPGLDRRHWRVVELRSADGGRPVRGRPGERVALRGGGALDLHAPYARGPRLWLARLEAGEAVEDYLAAHGEPIRYGYVRAPWPLDAYQNVYATTPGSSEMPSAGRPFTPELITALVARGIAVAPITLHCGVSSPERHESPFPEPFAVPTATARAVQATRSAGGRVIAVGTTVVRALETGRPSGWTDLVIGPDRQLSAVGGLITGWHEPEASHLQLLEAVGGGPLLRRSYDAALTNGYLWHEFGDSHLLLP